MTIAVFQNVKVFVCIVSYSVHPQAFQLWYQRTLENELLKFFKKKANNMCIGILQTEQIFLIYDWYSKFQGIHASLIHFGWEWDKRRIKDKLLLQLKKSKKKILFIKANIFITFLEQVYFFFCSKLHLFKISWYLWRTWSSLLAFFCVETSAGNLH